MGDRCKGPLNTPLITAFWQLLLTIKWSFQMHIFQTDFLQWHHLLLVGEGGEPPLDPPLTSLFTGKHLIRWRRHWRGTPLLQRNGARIVITRRTTDYQCSRWKCEALRIPYVYWVAVGGFVMWKPAPQQLPNVYFGDRTNREQTAKMWPDWQIPSAHVYCRVALDLIISNLARSR